MEDLPVTTIVGAWGFAAGLVFGITAQRTNFCTMGAISDVVFMGSYSRMRAWHSLLQPITAPHRN